MSIENQLRDLAARWADVPAGERANAQLYLSEQALKVEPPQPRGSGYEFELPVKVVSRDGKESVNFIDLFKRGCFVLEAKDADTAGSDDARLRRAFGQALSYTHALPGGPPPYLLVLDVGSTLLLWDRWAGSFGGFNLGQRIHLPTLADHPEQIALLRDVWTQPHVRDPRARAAAVTREVAARLAELSASLEKRGFPPELVARFLMRCVFTMFAEDVGLLPGHPFQEALQTFLSDPEEFASATFSHGFQCVGPAGPLPSYPAGYLMRLAGRISRHPRPWTPASAFPRFAGTPRSRPGGRYRGCPLPHG